MSSSKFVEILDTCDTPYSNANVSLEATIDETRRRSASSGSISTASDSSQSSSGRPSSPSSQTTATPVKTRLRAFSLRKNKA
ncbi:hypothetical protein WHR41_03141 [Cladosporium halotolerans]|uniref:Uncharacterized protein n=1 Tax=Cladosporium halotolerans TaxID=1052096 RepID=A0AB34KSV1_9PEZI